MKKEKYLLFMSKTCPQCQKIIYTLSHLKNKNNLKVVDTDEFYNLEVIEMLEKYNVQDVPNLFILKNDDYTLYKSEIKDIEETLLKEIG